MTFAHANSNGATVCPLPAARRNVFRGSIERLWALSRRSLRAVYYTGGGLGDELLLTAVARAARIAGRPIHILTDRPEVWIGNRDAATVQVGIGRWYYARGRNWIETDIRHLTYQTSGVRRHIAQQMADHLGVALPLDWRPILQVSAGLPGRGRIAVQTSCRGARYAASTKEWPQPAWRQLVGLLHGYELVQLGTPFDPPLEGTRDLRGQTSLAQAAELIAESACFVGLESGLMHVAAAVQTPAVILYGGRSHPSQTGYPFHRHITRQPPCSGCGLNAGCPHAVMCMDIAPEEVFAAIGEALSAAEAAVSSHDQHTPSQRSGTERLPNRE